MCSIAGIVWEAPSPEPRTRDVVRAMTRALSHRGPDGEGIAVISDGTLTLHRWHRDGSIAAPSRSFPASAGHSLALGMNRLAIRDVAHGHQPMFDSTGHATIVFNGEIYDCDEIGADLARAGVRLKTRCDTEVILESYMRWGPACVDRLAGMFAFAIWDDRDGSLFMARDRLGIKPLVWAHGRGAFLFGSELKGLLATGLVDRRVRPEAINRYLVHGYVPAPDGPLEDVHLLEPGHTLTLREGRVEIRRYWSPSFAVAEQRPLAEHVDRFGSLLEGAVRSHLVSDVPVGAFLSGGLDSSSIVTLMKKLALGGVHTYTVGFDERAYDESRDAALTARFVGTKHHETRLALGEMEDLVVRVLAHYDQPFADSSAVPTWVLCHETAQHVKVALAGDGADEQLAGYPRARQYAVLEAMRNAPVLARLLGGIATGVAPMLGSRARRAKNFADYASVLRNGGAGDPMSGYIHLRNSFRGGWHARLLTHDFAQRVRPDDPSFHVHAIAARSDAQDPITRMLEVELLTYLPNDILQKVDMASGAHGLEVRVPFLDHRVVEAIAAMPIDAKLNRRESKVVLRRAMGPTLPPHTLTKRKQGFHFPVAEWLRGKGRPLVEDVLLAKRTKERGYFRGKVLDSMAAEHLSGRANHSTMLFSLLQLEIWHRTWV
ncbi:MAG TPA: asparagine synthase (glutamine-hydrolyzing), partial [Longimicrobium sp.]|nr:asparagine synthase (glutamine-hydrolyzing) [Longimicrobium sp.]